MNKYFCKDYYNKISNVRFPAKTDEQILKHLAGEVVEAAYSVVNERTLTELADVALCVIAYCGKHEWDLEKQINRNIKSNIDRIDDEDKRQKAMEFFMALNKETPRRIIDDDDTIESLLTRIYQTKAELAVMEKRLSERMLKE